MVAKLKPEDGDDGDGDGDGHQRHEAHHHADEAAAVAGHQEGLQGIG